MLFGERGDGLGDDGGHVNAQLDGQALEEVAEGRRDALVQSFGFEGLSFHDVPQCIPKTNSLVTVDL